MTDVNVLSAGVLNQIISKFTTLSLSHNKSICAQQAPVAMYSASAVDKATQFCFFDI